MRALVTTTLLAFAGTRMYIKTVMLLPQQRTATTTAIAKQPYDTVKTHIVQLRLHLQHVAQTSDTALQPYFVSAVVDSIVPYWYGTPWDFNGITQVPGKGSIACGYFVSTILRDAGLHLNRVKMGQSDSEGIIHTLAAKKDTRLFYDKPLSAFVAYIKSKGPGLYITGLDCHVGFILNDAKGCWFIHSKWYDEKAVVKEDAATSAVLYNSRYRMVGKISNNPALLAAWVSNRLIGL